MAGIEALSNGILIEAFPSRDHSLGEALSSTSSPDAEKKTIEKNPMANGIPGRARRISCNVSEIASLL